MHPSYSLLSLFIFLSPVFTIALPQIRTIETTFTTIITTKDSSITTHTSSHSQQPRNLNNLASELSAIKSLESKDCSQVKTFDGITVFDCKSLLQDLGFRKATSTTVEISTVTVNPVQATDAVGKRDPNVLTIDGETFTLVSSLDLGPVKPDPTKITLTETFVPPHTVIPRVTRAGTTDEASTTTISINKMPDIDGDAISGRDISIEVNPNPFSDPLLDPTFTPDFGNPFEGISADFVKRDIVSTTLNSGLGDATVKERQVAESAETQAYI